MCPMEGVVLVELGFPWHHTLCGCCKCDTARTTNTCKQPCLCKDGPRTPASAGKATQGVRVKQGDVDWRRDGARSRADQALMLLYCWARSYSGLDCPSDDKF